MSEPIQSLDFPAFLDQIDKYQELRGIRVLYWDGFRLNVIRQGPPLCSGSLKAVVIKPDTGESMIRSPALAKARESKLYTEVITGIGGCTGAILSWSVIVTGAGAAPLTGGSSTILTGLAWTGAVSGTVSCGNSLYRIYNEVSSPEDNDMLDQEGWYVAMNNALDAVGLIGVGISGSATVQMALHLRNVTQKSMIQVIKGLPRQQRKKLAEESIRILNPGISNSQLKMLVNAGQFPKRFTQSQVSQAVKNQLKDAAGALLGFVGSAYSGLVRKGINLAFEDEQPPTPPPKPRAGGGFVLGLVNSYETL